MKRFWKAQLNNSLLNRPKVKQAPITENIRLGLSAKTDKAVIIGKSMDKMCLINSNVKVSLDGWWM